MKLTQRVLFLLPGDIRNDLYLTLERGDFERGGKSVQKNIEVTIYVLYADGEILKVGVLRLCILLYMTREAAKGVTFLFDLSMTDIIWFI